MNVSFTTPTAAPHPDLQIVETGKPDGPGGLPDPEDLPRHILHIAALRGLGYPLRSIGRNYGVTPQAISVLLARHKASLRAARHRAGLQGLSPRAVNVLGRLRVNDRAEARAVTDWEDRLRGLRNCGQKTIAEILAWASDGAA
jgi:hypothetical protein